MNCGACGYWKMYHEGDAMICKRCSAVHTFIIQKDQTPPSGYWKPVTGDKR